MKIFQERGRFKTPEEVDAFFREALTSQTLETLRCVGEGIKCEEHINCSGYEEKGAAKKTSTGKCDCGSGSYNRCRYDLLSLLSTIEKTLTEQK